MEGDMRKTNWLILTALLLVTAVSAGCDTNKDKRASVLKQIDAVEADLALLNEQQAAASGSAQALPAEIRQYADSLQQQSQRRTKLQDELNLYILDHKLATVAVMATAGGVAGVVSDNMDEDTKNALGVIGFIGLLYCVANAEECADVTARILYFGSQIEAADKSIGDLTAQLAAKRQALERLEQELAALAENIGTKTGERDALKRQHDSLLCRFCL
jgi:septal ring factor EnvC (AmiA/AmiB activator)